MNFLDNKKVVQSVAFTTLQLRRLEKLRLTDGASISEHVRRALEMYLNSKGIEV